MSLKVGGPLGLEAMALLAGGDAPAKAFQLMPRNAQAEAVKRMSAEGMGDHEIAACTGLAVTFIRQVIGTRGAAA